MDEFFLIAGLIGGEKLRKIVDHGVWYKGLICSSANFSKFNGGRFVALTLTEKAF